jgi:hypothetical protein
MHLLLRIAAILWASPYTALGLTLGLAGLCTGGRVQRRGPVVEFYGGFVRWFVAHLPPGPTTMGFTLGHTVLGQTAAGLDLVRNHELVHVRQFERWGPVMGPAYLLSSLVLWLLRRDPYRENPFEREAYAADKNR